MAKPSLASYADIAMILRPALAADGQVEYLLPSHKEAVLWRHRAYNYRIAAQKNSEGQPTPLDLMVLSIEARGSEGYAVVIQKRSVNAGKLLINGEQMQIEQELSAEELEAVNEALRAVGIS